MRIAFPFLLMLALPGCHLADRAKDRLETKAADRAHQLGARLGESVDKALMGDTYAIKVSDDLGRKGIQVTRADRIKDGRLKPGDRGVALYVVFQERFAGNVEVRALDREHREVGRAYLRLQGPKGSAKWLNAPLDPHTPMEAIETVELK